MKFLHLVWSNLEAQEAAHAADAAFDLRRVCAVRLALRDQGGVHRRRHHGRRGPAVVRHKVSLIMTLPVTYKARMERIPGVASASHFTWFSGIYQNEPKNFFGTFPVEPGTVPGDVSGIHAAGGPEAGLAENTHRRDRRALARPKRFKWKIGDRVPLTSPIWPRKGGERVGVRDRRHSRRRKEERRHVGLLFPLRLFRRSRAYGEGLVGWYAVRVKDPDRAAEIAKAIDEEFANSPYETKAEPEGAFMQGFAQQIGDIGTILIAILSAVFFTILLVAGNTMAQAVRERTEELGVLKAMGFTNELVLALVLAESCLIAGLGGLAGLGLAWLITSRGSPVPSMLPVFYLPPRYLVIGVGTRRSRSASSREFCRRCRPCGCESPKR